MKKLSLLFGLILIILVFTNSALAKRIYFPVSLGVYWGNIMAYNPDLHIVANYPDIETSFVGDLAILKYGKDTATAYVNYVNKIAGDAMGDFLREAKKLALKNGAHYYGVSDFKLRIVYVNNALLVISSGDIVCGN